MSLKTAHWSSLDNKHNRACAKLAAIARGNTIFGGSSALVIAKRARLKNFPAVQIVSDVYSASTGKWSKKWEAWECIMCGQAHLGHDAAWYCCGDTTDGYPW
jgi:hypothetical protein